MSGIEVGALVAGVIGAAAGSISAGKDMAKSSNYKHVEKRVSLRSKCR
jgi:hypothetical protein